jgi:hypothetical protein
VELQIEKDGKTLVPESINNRIPFRYIKFQAYLKPLDKTIQPFHKIERMPGVRKIKGDDYLIAWVGLVTARGHERSSEFILKEGGDSRHNAAC